MLRAHSYACIWLMRAFKQTLNICLPSTIILTLLVYHHVNPNGNIYRKSRILFELFCGHRKGCYAHEKLYWTLISNERFHRCLLKQPTKTLVRFSRKYLYKTVLLLKFNFFFRCFPMHMGLLQLLRILK